MRDLYRWVTRRCMDCGKQLDASYYRGDVCSTCFDAFNGMTIEQLMDHQYTDTRFCGHCKAITPHICQDDNHERDSSMDRQCCKVCGWWKIGMARDYQPPIDLKE